MSFKANDVIKMVSNHYWNIVEITYEYNHNDFDEDDLEYELMDIFNNER